MVQGGNVDLTLIRIAQCQMYLELFNIGVTSESKVKNGFS